MSAPQDCCQPCSTTISQGAPGVPGNDGLPGADGINAYTATTADFQVPILNGNITVSVVNSAWMAVGQSVFIAGAGYFTVVSLPTTTSATLNYTNTAANTNVGATITAGAAVSPSGTSLTVVPGISNYNLGGSQALTNSYATVLSTKVTLTKAGTYLLFSTCRLDFAAATFSTTQTATVKLKCTNNTVADVANAISSVATGTRTTVTFTLEEVVLPVVQYTATAGDTIEMQAVVSAAPDAGALNAVETSIFAIQLM